MGSLWLDQLEKVIRVSLRQRRGPRGAPRSSPRHLRFAHASALNPSPTPHPQFIKHTPRRTYGVPKGQGWDDAGQGAETGAAEAVVGELEAEADEAEVAPVVDEDEDEMLPSPKAAPPPPPRPSDAAAVAAAGDGETAADESVGPLLGGDRLQRREGDPHESAHLWRQKRSMSVDDNFVRISMAHEQLGRSTSSFSRSSSLAHAGELGRGSSVARRRDSRGVMRKVSQLDVLKLRLDNGGAKCGTQLNPDPPTPPPQPSPPTPTLQGEINQDEFEGLSAELAHAELQNLVQNGMLTQQKYEALVREDSGMFTASNRDLARMDTDEGGDSDAEDAEADTGVMAEAEAPIDETQAKSWDEADTGRLLNRYVGGG